MDISLTQITIFNRKSGHRMAKLWNRHIGQIIVKFINWKKKLCHSLVQAPTSGSKFSRRINWKLMLFHIEKYREPLLSPKSNHKRSLPDLKGKDKNFQTRSLRLQLSISCVRSNCFQSQSRVEGNTRIYLFLVILFVEYTSGWKSLFKVSQLNRFNLNFFSAVIISAIWIMTSIVPRMEPTQILWLNVPQKIRHFVSCKHRNANK